MMLLGQNLATILVGGVLSAVVALTVWRMWKRKKENAGGACGCSCSTCPFSNDCH